MRVFFFNHQNWDAFLFPLLHNCGINYYDNELSDTVCFNKKKQSTCVNCILSSSTCDYFDTFDGNNTET